MSDLAHLKARVHGKVQGVYYRAFTFRIAKNLSLKGWVKNSRSGDVELEAEGTRAGLETFLKELNVGPAGASVTQIDVMWSAYTGNFSSFDVRY